MTSLADELFEQVAPLPIVSPHGHVDAALLAEDQAWPDPATLLHKLSGEGAVAGPAAAPQAKGSRPTAQLPADFGGLIAALERSGKHQLALQLHDQVGLVRYAPPELAVKPLRPLGGDWPRELALALKGATGTTWQVTLSDDPGEPSLLHQEKIAEERVRADVLTDPNVRAVMDAFPEAELESFNKGA